MSVTLTHEPGKLATETRRLEGRIELRESDDGTVTLTGKAIVYNSLSDDLWGMREKFIPGAFASSLEGDDTDDVRALAHHNRDQVIGRQSAGTLRLNDQPDALYFEIDMPKTSYANDLVESIRRGDITGMSFGFRAIEDEWDYDDTTGANLRTVKKARLREISPVSWPAYPQSVVDAEKRNLSETLDEVRAKLQESDKGDDTGDGGDGGGTLNNEHRESLELWRTQIELESGATPGQ
jgi:hypothetical protein